MRWSMFLLSKAREWIARRRLIREQSKMIDDIIALSSYAIVRHLASVSIDDIPSAIVHKNTTRLALKQRLIATELAYNSMKTVETIIDMQNAQILLALYTGDRARSICVAYHAVGTWAQILHSLVKSERIRIEKAKSEGKIVNGNGDVFVMAEGEMERMDSIRQQELFDDKKVS